MKEPININMGELAVGHNDARIKTGSIGSCVVVVLYDDETKVGGMAHAMLPSRKNQAEKNTNKLIVKSNNSEAAAKYADEAVSNLVREIEKIGGKKSRFRAKLVGGAKMFKILSGDKFGIGFQNVVAAKKRLEELSIPVESEDTGGTVGKLAELDLRNGLVDVSTKM